MKVSATPCKRGGIALRGAHGHCLCEACLAFRREQTRKQNIKRRAKIAAWLKANPEKQRQYRRSWEAAHPEKHRAVVKSWRDLNPDKVAAMNARAGAKWTENNRGRRNAITARRRAALLQRSPAWANAEAIAQIYSEAARLTQETGIPHEVDHILPLQGKTVSGLHVESNLRVLARSANRAKQNRLEGHHAA